MVGRRMRTRMRNGTASTGGGEVKAGGEEKIIAVVKVRTGGKGGRSRERRCSGGNVSGRERGRD
jgi:hypothetical protein